ncbi:MAG: REP-associated tyrosine transposase [Pseudomonadota bacterium]|jgi:putative transposase|nr:REP-associated tyrosine transposase [Pseudomonadota bacterium]
MGRSPRLLLADFPHHIVQRGHNRNVVFVDAGDYQYYLANLKEWKQKYAVDVHAWCLMSNHVHLVLTPRRRGAAISDLMRRLSARQCRYVNRLERRLGTLWCGRFRSSVIDTDGYLLACLRYVELNPVRAGIVGHPVDYPWSSYRERMGLAAPAVLDADPVTVRAGESADDRRRRYTAYFATSADHAEDELIRRSVNRNQLTGGDVFIRDIQLRTGLWIESRGRGRPARGNEK